MDQPLPDAQAIIQAARETAAPAKIAIDSPIAFVVPEGALLHQPDIHQWRDAPVRATGVYRPATVEAFKSYTEHHAAEDYTTIWIHPTSGKVIAVFDDNAAEGPGYGEHRAELDLEKTPEWHYWTAKDREMMSQQDFAEHIEGGLEEIVEPDSAEMLEIAQTFQASVGSTFRSSIRLQSGQQQLQYDEEVAATAGTSGQMTVPTRILLGIAPFIGEDPYKITARLRFRLHAGKLSLGYILDRPDQVIREAIESIAEVLTEKFERVYVGAPRG